MWKFGTKFLKKRQNWLYRSPYFTSNLTQMQTIDNCQPSLTKGTGFFSGVDDARYDFHLSEVGCTGVAGPYKQKAYKSRRVNATVHLYPVCSVLETVCFKEMLRTIYTCQK